jgi:hypothetical protein
MDEETSHMDSFTENMETFSEDTSLIRRRIY